jgi:large subunit ribosomal protein L22
MDVVAITKYIRISPSKVRDVAKRLQGLNVKKAMSLVTFNKRRGAFYLLKTLKSAVANARQKTNISEENLWVKESVVLDGPRLKRYWPRSRGMVSPILRRMCHIKIVLTDQNPDKQSS